MSANKQKKSEATASNSKQRKNSASRSKATGKNFLDSTNCDLKPSEKRKHEIPLEKEIGYVHDLSEKTRNKNNTMDYCTFKLQTSPKKFKDALLYSPTKRKILKTSEDSRTPIKLERFTYSNDGKKIIVNDVTRMSSPDASECLFQYISLTPESEEFTTIQSVLDNADEYDKVNLKGKVFELHENRPNNTNLHLVSGLLVDLEATIQIDVWEPHIASVQNNNAYSFMSLTVRVWNGRKKVALGRQGKVYALMDSPLTLITEDKIEKFPEDELGSVGIEEVCSISNIEVFHSCLNCNRKLIQVSGGLVSQCDNCGHAMKLSKCQQRVCMSFVIEEQEDQKKQIKTLTVFQEQLLSIVSQDMLFDKPAIQEYFLTATGIDIKYNKMSLVVNTFTKRDG